MILAIPVLSLCFFKYAVYQYDSYVQEQIAKSVYAHPKLSPAEKQETITFFKEHPPSKILNSNDPALAAPRQALSNVAGDYIMFGQFIGLAWACIGVALAAMFLAGISAAGRHVGAHTSTTRHRKPPGHEAGRSHRQPEAPASTCTEGDSSMRTIRLIALLALAALACLAPAATAQDPSIAPGERRVPVEKIPAPPGTLIEHHSVVRVGNDWYGLVKGRKTVSNELLETAFDRLRRGVSPERVRAAWLAQFQRYGKVHPALARRLQKDPQSPQLVMLWVKTDPMPVLDRPESADGLDAALKRLDEQARAALERFRQQKETVVKRLELKEGETLRHAADAPVVVAKLSTERIKALAQNPDVAMILLFDPVGRTDLATALSIAGADTAQANGADAKDVKVAVWEDCADNTAQLAIVSDYATTQGIACNANSHTTHVTGIVCNTSATPGFAPKAKVYAANTMDLAALDWAVDTIRVSALNQSFHRDDEINDGMSSDDIYKDYKVLQYPWPTIVQAAGNWCGKGSTCYESGDDAGDEFVNHKGFNSISAGNHDDTATSMVASSCFVNPTSPHGDRELPEICANGDQVTVLGVTKTGTSMASPATTGSVALLQGAQPILKIWPEGIRALLFAGAVANVASHNGVTSTGASVANAPNTWWEDVRNGRDAFDGAGALNVNESITVAGNRWKGAAAPRAWDIGTLRHDGSFDRYGWAEKTWQVTVPKDGARRTVRVGLAWNSTATARKDAAAEEVFASVLDLDLDVRVFDAKGKQVAASLSWDNSYEVVDFVGTAGQTYTIKVHRWSGKPGAWSWFGIAWNVY